MDSNQSGAVGGIIWGPFPGSWTHLGASRGLKRNAEMQIVSLLSFQPPSAASDVFSLGSLVIYLLTIGKTWIKTHEEVEVFT